MMRVSVFGLGYVGSVSAACLANSGHRVVGVDIDENKVDMINSAIPPVVEPGLREMLVEVVGAERLRATHSSEEAVRDTDIALVCVGTPGDPNGQLNTDILRRVAQEIGCAAERSGKPYTVVVRSTTLPGTIDNVVAPALVEGAGRNPFAPVTVAVNPEFIREGSALKDFAQPPITLVGCDTTETADQLRALYTDVEAPFVHTGKKTAEMVKYASNAFHALKICFANEIGDICDVLGADAQEVMKIFRMDRKLNISDAYLRPGFAFGGSCLPKDLRALVYAAGHADVATPMLGSLLPSNELQIRQAVNRVLSTRRRRVGVAGLSFKPGTDDLRESPLVALVESLIGKGCDVRILDRNVSLAQLVGANRRYIEEEVPHIATLMCNSAEALVEHADTLVIGNSDEEASRVVQGARADQEVIDLTRGGLRRSSTTARAA